MTVAELIARLQEMPKDAPVFIFGDQLPWGYDDMSEDYIEYHDGSDRREPGVWLGLKS